MIVDNQIGKKVTKIASEEITKTTIEEIQEDTQAPSVLNILLIDDDEEDYILTAHMLSEVEVANYHLDWASSYKEGLEKVSANNHDAFLVDYYLDGQNTGLKLLHEAISNGCKAPLILLTGRNNREADFKAMNAGATDFLIKDEIGPALLDRSIRYSIEQKKLQADLQNMHDKLKERIAERTAELSETNEVLQEKITELEQLKQQTQESLEWRTRQVETSTQIAQEIAAVSELGSLFKQIVNLIRDKFGYYHVHVYTLEDNNLYMQQGTGAAGRMMKQVKHKIPFNTEKSIVAKTARTGSPILVQDVTKEEYWLPNQLLSETRSELAVPIKLGDTVLGVLDVQHEEVDGINQEDQILLMGLCGQIAVAINNQRLEMERRKAEEARERLIMELDAFGHTVGYNLKDPVDLIIGYTATLKEKARLPEELEEYLNSIARNSHKLNNVIEELQLLSGIRKDTVELRPLNMVRIIAEVQQRLAYLIQEHQARIVISEYWPVALGHTPWIEEVWANYISNAIKYGGNPPRVQLGATSQSDGMIRFWVRDNGPGLTKEEQEQLFTKFTNLNQVSIKGHGMGLSIVHRIITKLGGEVGVTSDGIPGEGCIFTFTLPGAKR